MDVLSSPQVNVEPHNFEINSTDAVYPGRVCPGFLLSLATQSRA
jgi:hypothetical protein